jgi:hypothetical protein
MKKLNVLGSKVTVKLVAPKNPNHVAEYDDVTKIINLTPTSPTLCKDYGHEVFHAFWKRLGMSQTDVGDNIEEMLSEGFSNFFDDNIVTLYQTYNELKKIQQKK